MQSYWDLTDDRGWYLADLAERDYVSVNHDTYIAAITTGGVEALDAWHNEGDDDNG